MTSTLAYAPVAPPAARMAFIDNLRWSMIVLVISMHAAVTYSHLGSWYYMEGDKPPVLTLAAFATYQVYLQAFFMGLLFLIAGYFVPPAFDRKGPRVFLRHRAVRLGIPSLLFMLGIQPIVVFGLLHQYDPRPPHPVARAYWRYVRSGNVLSGSGPMWFTLALLGFCAVYALVRIASPATPEESDGGPLPGNRQLIALALLMGACTFLVRIVQPIGTSILNMQLCFFSQYILLFVVGIYARRRNWLARFPRSRGLRWMALALAGGLPAWLVLVAFVTRAHVESQIAGGFTWPSVCLSAWEAFVCLGMCLGLIVLFRDHFNTRGPVSRWLSDNSFAVYLFHTPMLILVTFALARLPAAPGLKFVMATVSCTILTYLASSLVFRQVPLLKRIL